jgi:hypothetical protein
MSAALPAGARSVGDRTIDGRVLYGDRWSTEGIDGDVQIELFAAQGLDGPPIGR